MKDFIKQYVDRDISRRALIRRLDAAGLSTVAAAAVADVLTPVAAIATTRSTIATASALGTGATGAYAVRLDAASSSHAYGIRNIQGSGGQLLVEQLEAAGAKYLFFNPSTGDAPIFDAMVAEHAI